MADDTARERRLAEALRANLRRRKAQDRALRDTGASEPDPAAPGEAGPEAGRED